ncbi:MAG: phosphate ABC transporter permease subunit PstC [Mariprofundaceae bacterium]|nr:phosphate ABC transporter permease subunit PstC [Mariprofundaceae bacterium]
MNVADLSFYFFAGLLPLSVMAWMLGRNKVTGATTSERWNSRPGHYGWYSVIWLAAPALAVALLAGLLHLTGLYPVSGTVFLPVAFMAAAAGCWQGLRLIRPSLRAMYAIEKVIRGLLITAAFTSILTTIGIVIAIIFEAVQFFGIVSFWDFITGTQWSPDAASGENVHGMFGSIPIFAGTFMITLIAMMVAVPIGLLSAIFIAEYATENFRNIAKPALEILAGIPTVVYGFFAAITVSPLVVKFADSVGLHADYTNALAPGLVMGIMIIPFISSLSDDVIRAVPQSMREGSLALGTTMSETIRQILLPAALPGIVAAFLLAISRALGETMIVVMAAGLRPNLTWNPLEGMTTVTVRIVDALTGDQAFDSPETLSAFGLGLVLLVITLILNVISIYVIRRFRQSYE